MSRWFNTAGPCRADKHYMLPPTSRLPDLETPIEKESYFVAIIEPMLAGLELGDVPNDDIQFVIDLGLCKMHPLGGLAMS